MFGLNNIKLLITKRKLVKSANRLRKAMRLNSKKLKFEDIIEVIDKRTPPTEQDYKKYYERYCRKESNKNEWTTEKIMIFDEYKKKGLKFKESYNDEWEWLLSSSSNAMVGFPPNHYYI